MSRTMIPDGYQSTLSLYETQEAIALIKNGRTGLIKGFHKKDDAKKKFDAFLVLDQTDGKIKFDFQSEAEKEMFCPICKKPMRKTKIGYGCSFTVNSEISGKKLTESQILMLLQNGRTGLIKGFHKKNNPEETFSAVLKVDKAARRIAFDFPNK